MKKSIALILAILMLVPCFVTAASAEWYWYEYAKDSYGIADGYVRVKDVCVLEEEEGVSEITTEWSYNKVGQLTMMIKTMQGEDEATREVSTYSYSNNGILIQSTTSVEYVYEDGLFSRTQVTTKTFNENGDLLKSVMKEERDDGKTYSIVETNSYNKDGNLIKSSEKTVYDDGSKKTIVRSYVYNANGDLVKTSKNEKYADGNHYQTVTVYTYDRYDRLVKRSEKMVSDWGTELQEVNRYTYNSAGKVIKETYAYKSKYLSEEKVSTYSFDKAGILIKETHKEKTTYESSAKETEQIIAYAYDKNGRLKKKSDVMYGDKLRKTVTAYAYDKNGNVTKKVVGHYTDKVLEETAVEANTYNNSGKLTKTKIVIKSPKYNTTQSETRIYTYNKNGTPAKTVTTSTNTYGTRQTKTVVYDKNGNMLTSDSDRDYDDEHIAYIYDKNGRVVQYEYHYRDHDRYHEDDRDLIITNEFDEHGNLIQTSESDVAFETTKVSHTYTYEKIGA